MPLNRRHRTTTRQQGSGSKAGLWIVVAALLAGMLWLAWKHNWIRKEARTDATALTTNSPLTQAAATQQLARVQTAASNSPAPLAVRMQTNPPPVASLTNQAVLRTNGPAYSSALLAAQIALDRLAISPGSIDGVLGSQTRAALRAYQKRESLPPTGDIDAETRARLLSDTPGFATYAVTGTEIERLGPVPATWLGKSEQARLNFETLLEMLAERSHAHPTLLKRLNPGVYWDNIAPGTPLTLLDSTREPPRSKAAYVQIRLAERTLEAFDAEDRLLAHFPCSIARRVEKRPLGELHVAVTAPCPNFTFDPEVFPESAEGRELGRKLIIPPGPNNPVGTVWIGLDKPGYGIHGTPRPEEVGRTESHGCFRLANWNAEYLLQLVSVGTPVRVLP